MRKKNEKNEEKEKKHEHININDVRYSYMCFFSDTDDDGVCMCKVNE